MMVRLAPIFGLIAWAGITAGVWTLCDILACPAAPARVVDAVKVRFPAGTITRASLARNRAPLAYDLNVRIPTAGGRNCAAKLQVSPLGKVLRVEIPLPSRDLPAAVARRIRATYPDGRIRSAKEITTRNKLVWYEIRIASPGQPVLSVDCSPQGDLVHLPPDA